MSGGTRTSRRGGIGEDRGYGPEAAAEKENTGGAKEGGMDGRRTRVGTADGMAVFPEGCDFLEVLEVPGRTSDSLKSSGLELTTWCLWVVLKNVSRLSLPRNL